MTSRGSVARQSSIDAASAASADPDVHGIPDEDEDAYLLNNYDASDDLESQSREHGSNPNEKPTLKTTRRVSLASRLLPWRWSRTPRESSPRSKRRSHCRTVKRPCWIVAAIFGICAILSLLSIAWDSILSILADSRDSDIIPGQPPSQFSDWLTHGINPIPCHSHNDYWRRVPLFSALAVGCTSVEADIWLDGDELRVGHTRHTILPNQSLRSLYINPLLEILDHHNPGENGSTSATESSREKDDSSPIGVFVTDPNQTLVLLIDFKSTPDLLWPIVMNNLDPLRQRGYLTHFNGTTLIHRPITVVATGDAPFDKIQASSSYRDIFYDAPLDKLIPFHSDSTNEMTSISDADSVSPYTQFSSYYASVNFHASIGSLYLGRLSQDQLDKVRTQIKAAHERGLKVRYWGTPGWPVGLRNYVWRVLVREGVDMLNVDDLRAAGRVDWGVRGWWG